MTTPTVPSSVSLMGGDRLRILVAVIVYNGRSFVPRALSSIARLSYTSRHEVDVLVLDDASPDPGWSAELSDLCTQLGIGCYTSPRNLGIPRNMNLGLLRAEANGYDACILLNSDVVVAESLVDQLVAVAQTGTAAELPIASVTAWANDVSMFSLPNAEAAVYLADQQRLDATAKSLINEFGLTSVDLPTGCGFCLYIPAAAIDAVGLMDPVFGRGYAEEVDWCCRAVERGWRHVLAPSAFAFHMGSATNTEAGLLAKGMRTVTTNEALVDHRHPWYRPRLDDWSSTDPLPELRERAIRRLISDAARSRGVVVDATWLTRPGSEDDERVRVVVAPDGVTPRVEARADGWRLDIAVGDDGPIAAIAGLLGVLPSQVRLHDEGDVTCRLAVEARELGIAIQRKVRYPERV